MSEQSRHFKLGLFVIVGVGLLVAGVVVLGAGVLFTEYVRIETATMESVQGLDVGGAVKFKGVTVGKIAKIEMASWRHSNPDPEKQRQVRRYVVIEMDIRRDALRFDSTKELSNTIKSEVAHGLRVKQAMAGITGPAYLEAVFVDPDTTETVLPPWPTENLYIPSVPSTISQIVTSIEDILMKFRQVDIDQTVGHVNKLLADADKAINDLQAATLREKAVALVDEVRESNRRVKALLDDPRVDKTIQDLSEAVASGKEVIAAPEIKAFLADLPKISGRMRTTMERLDETAHDPKIRQTLDGLGEAANAAGPAAADLRRLLRKVDAMLSAQSQDLESIVTNLRRVLENGAALAEDAKNNPSRALFGSPPPRVKVGGEK
jgi:paraquat-inducible protein B